MKTPKRPKHRPKKINEETLGQAVYPGKEAWKNEPGNRYTPEDLREMERNWKVEVFNPQELRRSHEWIDRRSLALDLAIVKKLQASPALMERAKTTLNRWMQQRQPAVPPVMREWHTILHTWPNEKIMELLTRFDEDARRLRQSSPFCGILSEEERLAIFREFEK